jgi:hypothetical protein
MKLRGFLLSSTAIAAAAIISIGAPSSAASLGSLEKRVKALEKSGASKSVSRAKSTIKFKISGQINRAVQRVDNGLNSEIRHVTNTNSQNKLSFSGTGYLSDNIKVQARAEVGNDDSGSDSQSVTSTDVGNNTGFATTRYMELIITRKSMGTLYLGHGEDATDGTIASGDLSGTSIAMSGGADEDLHFGREQFVNSVGTVQGTVDTFNNEMDGTRQDRIRYDTPSLGGLKISVSHGNDDTINYGLRYGGNFNGVKVSAAIGTAKNDGNSDIDTTSASIGALLPMGLNFQFATGERNLTSAAAGRNNPTMNYYRAGYRFKGSEIGETRLAVSLHDAEDNLANGDEFQSLNFAVVQVIASLGTELYAAYSNVNLTRTAVTDIQDIDVITMGFRLNF